MVQLTESQEIALALIPKISGPFSMFGSCWILYEILRDRSKWRKPYHRLLFSMCIWDVFASFADFLSTWPMPVDESDRWGASGTVATCSAQGFFHQANIASPIFNFMLSYYFLLKVRYRYSDDKILAFTEPVMQLLTLSFGLGTAAISAGLNIYADSTLWCWINASPQGCLQTFLHGYTTCERGDNAEIFRWVFFFGPLWTAGIGSMITMAMLYQYVYHTEKQSARWDHELEYAKRMVEASLKGEDFAKQQFEAVPPPDFEGDIDNHSVISYASSFYGNQSLASALGASVSSLWKRNKTQKKKKKEFRKSKIVAKQAYRYVAVFYLTWLAATVNRFLQLIQGESYFWVMVLHGFFTPLQGWLNFLVYMYPKYQGRKLMRKKRRNGELQARQQEQNILNNSKEDVGGSTFSLLSVLQSISLYGFQYDGSFRMFGSARGVGDDCHGEETPPISKTPPEIDSVQKRRSIFAQSKTGYKSDPALARVREEEEEKDEIIGNDRNNDLVPAPNNIERRGSNRHHNSNSTDVKQSTRFPSEVATSMEFVGIATDEDISDDENGDDNIGGHDNNSATLPARTIDSNDDTDEDDDEDDDDLFLEVSREFLF